MQVQLLSRPRALADQELVALVVGEENLSSLSLAQVPKLDAKAWQPVVQQAVAAQEFTGARGQRLLLHGVGAGAGRLALVGLGSKERLGADTWLHAGGECVRLAEQGQATGLQIIAPVPGRGAGGGAVHQLALGAHLATYRFAAYKSGAQRARRLEEVAIASGRERAWSAAERGELARAEATARAVIQARNWVNEPAMRLTPAVLATAAAAMARRAQLKCEVLDERALARRKMNMILGVGMGSANPPRLVHLRYLPPGRRAAEGPTVLVGKGITFDAGGLCLKPPDGMMGMKVDMGGAAAVLATLGALAELRVPREVHGIVALAENMPSGTALRPGDILTHASGKTVEVNNTDAEGRLVLADALHVALAQKPACIVDVATLTGACMVALGPHTAGMFANDEDLAASLATAAAAAGEDIWRLPLTEALRDQLKSDVADMRNTGERYGGAITAALFLRTFAGSAPWAHLDIAGPVTSSQASGARGKGATGFGVATLLQWLAR